jgi:hypothetical protein
MVPEGVTDEPSTRYTAQLHRDFLPDPPIPLGLLDRALRTSNGKTLTAKEVMASAMDARRVRRGHNRGAWAIIAISLVSIAIPAVARAQPYSLSVPTASISPLNVAALADSASVLSAHPAWSQSRGNWFAQGATVAARRTGQITTPRELAAPPAPAPASPYVTPWGRADWYAIAACESGGRWDLNSQNGFWGGLQFLPSTWFAYGGGPFDGMGPFPYSAGQQIAVAERILAGQGPSAWPNCFRWA